MRERQESVTRLKAERDDIEMRRRCEMEKRDAERGKRDSDEKTM